MLEARLMVAERLVAARERERASRVVLQRFEIIARQARDVILVVDQDGRILDCNDAALATYKYNRADLLACNIRDLRTAPTLADVPLQMEKANESGVLFETWHRRSDGTTFRVRSARKVP